MANYIKFTVVAEVSVADDKIKWINSLGNDITIESYIESVISDHVRDRGMLCKLDVIEGEVYNETKEYAYEVLNHKAVEELEKEILEAKQCIGGTCED